MSSPLSETPLHTPAYSQYRARLRHYLGKVLLLHKARSCGYTRQGPIATQGKVLLLHKARSCGYTSRRFLTHVLQILVDVGLDPVVH